MYCKGKQDVGLPASHGPDGVGARPEATGHSEP